MESRNVWRIESITPRPPIRPQIPLSLPPTWLDITWIPSLERKPYWVFPNKIVVSEWIAEVSIDAKKTTKFDIEDTWITSLHELVEYSKTHYSIPRRHNANAFITKDLTDSYGRDISFVSRNSEKQI